MCKVYKLIFSLGLEMEDADCASILTDINTLISKIDSMNMPKDLIQKFIVKLVLCRLSMKWLHDLSSYTEKKH